MRESLRIKFGRPDRTYRFGERVTGWVMIQTPRGQECKRLRLKTFWRTHGKGNRDEGEPRVVTLHSGPLPDAGPHLFEFDFPAPPGPFTYHGRYLNVDHYVEVQVDLPWARDPKCSEEYLLLPGKPASPPSRLLEAPPDTMTGIVSPLGLFLGIASSVFGLTMILAENLGGLIFLLVGFILSIPALRRWAANRMGRAASAYLTSVVVGPGENAEVEVKVAPPKRVSMNRASMEMEAREICVSGSGSSRRTHRHTLYRKTAPLSGAVDLEGGEVRVFKGSIPLPDKAPLSFRGGANRLVWEVKVKLDIPGWPDWVKKIPLVVWPTRDLLGQVEQSEQLLPAEEPGAQWEVVDPDPEFVVPESEPPLPEWGPHVVGPPPWLLKSESPFPPPPFLVDLPGQEPEQEEEPGWVPLPPEVEMKQPLSEPEPLRSEPEVAGEEVELATEEGDEPAPGEPGGPAEEPEPEETPAGGKPSSPLHEALRSILDANIFGRGKDCLIRDLVGRPFDFTLEVKRVDRSFGVYSDAEYRNGRTVTGTLEGSELEVVVFFPASRNEEVQEWQPGSLHWVNGDVRNWDRLRKRPEFLARM
jgi:hypothetical protein